MSKSKGDLFLERILSPKNGTVSSETILLLYCILLLSLNWTRVMGRVEHLLRQGMVARLRQLGTPTAVNNTSSTALATKQQAGSTKHQARSTKRQSGSNKQQSDSIKQQAAPANPLIASTLTSKALELVVEVLEKATVEDRDLSDTNILIRRWLAKAIEYPFDCLCICPPIFNCLYLFWPYVMELNANYYSVLYFGAFGVSKATSVYIKLFLLNAIVFVCGVATLEVATFVLLGTALVLLWSWYGVLWVVATIRRVSVVHFIEDYIRVRSELASLRLEHDKCVDELETFRQDNVQRRCKMCLEVDATSIVMECRHIDLCPGCLGRLEERAKGSWFKGQCPQHEKRCSLGGKEAHVHCLICRGGGPRHKVFFA